MGKSSLEDFDDLSDDDQIDPDEVEEPDDPEDTEDEPQLASHVLQRGIVLDRFRILYVPLPKASCTAILWSLAELARLDKGDFIRSRGREVSRSLTIHDLSGWPDAFRFGKRSSEERDEVLAAEGWLRFTVGRDPFRRLWSAWQSKILLAEPQFIEKFSSEPWFPGAVKTSGDVQKAFREFMQAMQDDPDLVRADVHWAPQTELIEHPEVPYDHLGKVEALSDTIDLVRNHVSAVKGAVLPDLPRTNVTPLPYAAELFAESDIRMLEDAYGDDMSVFGYELPPPEALGAPCPPSWTEVVDTVVPSLAELRSRNERLFDMHQVVRSGRQDFFDMRREKNRVERFRREEHRRNERLKRRLHRTRREVQWMRNSLSWRITAPLRRAKSVFRKG